jgi:ribose transport system substrate-binding protein
MKRRSVLGLVALGLLIALCPQITRIDAAGMAARVVAAPKPGQPIPGNYKAPTPAFNPVYLEPGAQASCQKVAFHKGHRPLIAYMPPATEFNYYIAIQQGVKREAARLGARTFMLAPQSGADIAGQVRMLQDVLTRKVDAIILHAHDEQAVAPLVKQAIGRGIAVILVNSDILGFPTPVNGVVGYSEHGGTFQEGRYIVKMFHGRARVGVLQGLPGYDSTQRINGYLDAFKPYPGLKIVAQLPTEWNVETGDKAAMDMLQAHPEINVLVAANDYIADGAAQAAQALGRTKVAIFGNDGDPSAFVNIVGKHIVATVNTTPVIMGVVALHVTMDCLNKRYPGGWTQTPVTIVDHANVLQYLCHMENLYPKPSSADLKACRAR